MSVALALRSNTSMQHVVTREPSAMALNVICQAISEVAPPSSCNSKPQAMTARQAARLAEAAINASAAPRSAGVTRDKSAGGNEPASEKMKQA